MEKAGMEEARGADWRHWAAGVGCGLVAAVIWGAWPVVSRLGVTQTLSPYDLTALRFAVSGLVLLPIVWARGSGGLGLGRSLVLATGAGVPYVLVSITGLTFAPASHAGIVTPGCMMMFAALGGWLVIGDRPNGQRLAGIGIVVAGVCLLGLDGFSGAGSDVRVGDMMFVLSGALWAGFTVAVRRWSVDPLHATALVSVVSMAGFLPLYLIWGGSGLTTAPLGKVVFQALYQGVLAAVVALLAYTRAVAVLGACGGAMFGALVPAVAAVSSIPILNEWPTTPAWPVWRS